MPTSTLTSKGQITIPKEIRQHFQLRTGQRVEFQIGDSGQLVLKPKTQDIRSLKGILRTNRKRPVSLRAMDKAIAEGASQIT